MNGIHNARIFDGTAFRPESAVGFEDGVIVSLDGRQTGADAGGRLLAPGLIDLHTHGQCGFDSMRPGGIAGMAHSEPRYGTTAFLPASVSESDGHIRAYLSSVREAGRLLRGARVLGAHLEGPFLARETRGAHRADMLCDPETARFCRMTEGYEAEIARVTLAPELPGALALISALHKRRVMISLGHSAATAKETEAAVRAGIRSATHTFNGMRALDHRRPGVLDVALTNEAVSAEFIADLIHISPYMIRLIYKAKGSAGCYFCTDSVEAAGRTNGTCSLGGEPLQKENGAAYNREGRLAGSLLTMDQGLKNLVETVGLPLADALRMGTRNPADALGRSDLGRISPGAKADFVLLDEGLRVVATYVRGVCEYVREGSGFRPC